MILVFKAMFSNKISLDNLGLNRSDLSFLRKTSFKGWTHAARGSFATKMKLETFAFSLLCIVIVLLPGV